MANPNLIGAMPMPAPTPASSNPVAGGAIRPMPFASAGGVAAAARAFASPDFATDLARLVALLGAGQADAESPIVATDALADTDTPSSETGDAVDALCAEVALAVPGVAPPCALPVPADAPTGETATSDDVGVPDAAIGPRTPSRTLQVLLTPRGATVAAEHRSARAPEGHPESPTLPLLPAAAAGAAAFTVVAPTTLPSPQDAAVPDVAAPVAGVSDASSSTTLPGLVAAPVDGPSRPAPAPHAIAATVVDILQPQAPKQVAETVVWHVPAQGAAEVQIRLNPEELGPLDVQLKLDGDKVSVRFDLADERVRDVVQSSLPSLSSLLSARGLQLDQAQVFAQSRGQGSPQHPGASQAPWSSVAREGGDAEMSVTTVPRALIRRGLLDDYA